MFPSQTPPPADPPARLEPLPVDQWYSRVRRLPAGVQRDPGRGIPDIFTTLVRHPDLCEAFLGFGRQLLAGGLLSGRVRELLILRTARNVGAGDAWARHVPLVRREGLDDADMARLTVDDDAGWTDAERHLVRAADELHRDSRLSDQAWEALCVHWAPAEVIEILMLVGHYHMLAFFLNSAGVRPEPGFDDRLD